jgi:hypothetical protein
MISAEKTRIQNDLARLNTTRKTVLAYEVRMHHRVVDLRGVSKDVLVSMILEAKYGRRRVAEVLLTDKKGQ